MTRIRVKAIPRPKQRTYTAHLFVVLCFVLALKNSPELFVDDSGTLSAPFGFFILLSFLCPTFGNGSVPQCRLGADQGSESREQRPQRIQAILIMSVQNSGVGRSTNIISGWS